MFCFSIVALHIKSSVTLCQKSTMSNLKIQTSLKLLTVLVSPDLTGHRHQSHSNSTFVVQYGIKRQEIVHTGSKKNPHCQRHKTLSTITLPPMESYRINAACLSVSIYSKLSSRDWDKAQDTKHNPLSLRIKKNYSSCATTIKTTDVCVWN